MNDELNQIVAQGTPEECVSYRETERFDGNPQAEEVARYEDNDVAVRKKKAAGISKLFSLTGVVAALAAAVMFVPAIGDKDKTDVTFTEVYSTDSSIGYHITLDNRSDDVLRVVVSNKFTEREEIIEGDSISGVQDNLKPNMYYTVAVMNGDKTLAETELRTKRPDEMPVTEFRKVEHGCTCAVDGMFRFKMDFIDENGWWSDFSATLTDAYGNVSECVFTDDLTEEQTIAVTDSALRGTTAKFVITCVSRQNGESGKTVVLFEAQEEI